MNLNDIQKLINKFNDLEDIIDEYKQNFKPAYKNSKDFFKLAVADFTEGFNAIYDEIKYNIENQNFRPEKITFIKSLYKKACENLGAAIPELREKMELESMQMEK